MKSEPAPESPTSAGSGASCRIALAETAWVYSRPHLVAIVVALLGALITFWSWRVVGVRETRLVTERFDNLASRFLSDIQRHQGVHEQSLRAGAALLTVVGDVNAAQWRSIFDTLRVTEALPGVQGYGFAQAVPQDRLDAHVAKMRAQSFPSYTVALAGTRAFYTPIAFLEPFDWRNQRALGYDMYSSPERARAMSRAAETGMTAATGRVRLVQEAGVDEQPGFLLYTPVYRTTGADGDREPFAGLAGFVYSPVRVRDFIDALLIHQDAILLEAATIEVFDGPDASEGALIFRSEGSASGLGEYEVTRAHDFFGQTWTVRLRPTAAFVAAVDQQARAGILVGGAAISLMASALVLALAQRQRQREDAALRNDMIAREMSHRVKNLLAVIQSIASRTLSGDRSLEEARAVFSERIAALARAHTALVDGQWAGAQLRDLLHGELSPFGERVAMVGPGMKVNSQMAQNLAMAVHELATNAAKYGALSRPEGLVRIRWRVHPGPNGTPLFSFAWEETGGPAPCADAKGGFGRTLLRRLIGSTIGAEPTIEHLPGGLRYSFECPLERVGEIMPEATRIRR